MAFKILLEILNSIFDILNCNGYNIYDEENPEFYINKVYYDSNMDCLYFKTTEDKELSLLERR